MGEGLNKGIMSSCRIAGLKEHNFLPQTECVRFKSPFSPSKRELLPPPILEVVLYEVASYARVVGNILRGRPIVGHQKPDPSSARDRRPSPSLLVRREPFSFCL